MFKILVLYYSTYGHVETMAQAVAGGAAGVPGATVVVKRVPELMSEEVARNVGAKLDQQAPIATVSELKEYDAIIFGTPTRFGNMAAQMRNFLDQAGGLWAQNALVGKVGSAFVSTGTGAGNETTLSSFHTTLFHCGMTVVGVPYTVAALRNLDGARGGSPLGAGTLAGPDGRRQPSPAELEIAAAQGAHVAQVTRELALGRQALGDALS
ncbi:NAD(P)H:quinone oxidoreductase [Duganella sp. BJB1802]|uniref:NAD(P)H:quinone oxidoreductase n=1 Tax=Duganella sp. BJB1802 TaxID=2744575 RepID=UPI001593E0E0|nr:NAD(P)H:quinone oxidoreductase [Duganella sp. BJB1802]NVD69600.1 NAD(P)H:quinone oxidoreductase [Duganella sp. BJB1802]